MKFHKILTKGSTLVFPVVVEVQKISCYFHFSYRSQHYESIFCRTEPKYSLSKATFRYFLRASTLGKTNHTASVLSVVSTVVERLSYLVSSIM